MPATLPGALGNGSQRRLEAVGVVQDVALVAHEETGLVCRETAALARCALGTPPAVSQPGGGDLCLEAVVVVAVGTLGTHQQTAVLALSACPAACTQILQSHS